MRPARHSRGSGAHQGEGDEELVRELYVQHGRALHGFVTRLTDGNRPLGEQITQEVLRHATQRVDALAANRHDVRLWLFKLAREAAARHDDAAVGPPGVTGVDNLGKMVVTFDVQEAMTDLRPEHRDVLIELYYRGCSVPDLAARLHVPPATVTSRAYYAVRALRLALEERGCATLP